MMPDNTTNVIRLTQQQQKPNTTPGEECAPHSPIPLATLMFSPAITLLHFLIQTLCS